MLRMIAMTERMTNTMAPLVATAGSANASIAFIISLVFGKDENDRCGRSSSVLNGKFMMFPIISKPKLDYFCFFRLAAASEDLM